MNITEFDPIQKLYLYGINSINNANFLHFSLIFLLIHKAKFKWVYGTINHYPVLFGEVPPWMIILGNW